MELFDPSSPSEDQTDGVNDKDAMPEKTSADLLEALLGLIYLHCGYERTVAVADEMKVTVPISDAQPLDVLQSDGKMLSQALLDSISAFTGYGSFQNVLLVQEALVHPTMIHATTPSYQRLEWIGDAVLCLAIRHWIYSSLDDDSIPVGDCVSLENALVSNEVLAYISQRNGLPHHIFHRDQTLPKRIETYAVSVREGKSRLWESHPPKVLADVCESILGAVHLDGGFDAGQKAALTVLRPFLDLVEKQKLLGLPSFPRPPKHELEELGGRLIQVMGTEAKTGKNVSDTSLTAVVLCNGVRVAADTDSAINVTKAVAMNRACRLVVDALRLDRDLLERFQVIRKFLDRQASLQSNKRAKPDD
jgi:endoribonuclease Dicer